MNCCPRSETDLILYLYGELDGEAKAAFEVHLAGCALCRAEADLFSGAVERWRAHAPKIEAPQKCVDRALRGEREHRPGTLLRRVIEGLGEALGPGSILRPSWKPFGRPSVVAAAGAFVAVAVFIVFGIYHNPADEKGPTPRIAFTWDDDLGGEIEALRARLDRLSGAEPWQGVLFQASIDHRLDRLDRQMENPGFPDLAAPEIEGLDKIQLQIDDMGSISVL